MKDKLRLGMIVVTCAVLVAVTAIALTGCESAEGLAGLTLSPSYVELTSNSNLVEFAVIGSTNNSLALPLEWRLTNPSLGYIAAQSGYRALYFRYADNGDNVITAKDQYGNEGYATIRQIPGTDELTLVATRADTNTWTIIISPTTKAPYEWWVHDPTLGTISSEGSGQSAVYESDDTSMPNTIYARDARGDIGSISIP